MTMKGMRGVDEAVTSASRNGAQYLFFDISSGLCRKEFDKLLTGS